MDGWIKTFRKLKDWQWYKKTNMVHLFIHLLLSANHKDGKWMDQEVKRGQLITGRKQLKKETGISEQSIRTLLNKLISTNEITIESTNQYSIITICNYDSYQGNGFEDNQDNNQPSNQQLTSDQPAINQRLTTNKNVKKEKKDKKKSVFVPPILEDVVKYFKDKGYSESTAKIAFEYYQVANWVDSKGNPVKNWKQKMIAVWFKDENKIKSGYKIPTGLTL